MRITSRIVLIAAAGLIGSTGAASAVEVKKRTEAPGTPEGVWKIASDFCSIKTWHPAIASCEEGEGGKTRTLTTKDGKKVEEKMTAKDDLSYSYEITGGDLPVKNYKAKLWVEKDDEPDRVVILWTANFEGDDAAKKLIATVLADGVKGIKKIAVSSAGGKAKGGD